MASSAGTWFGGWHVTGIASLAACRPGGRTTDWGGADVTVVSLELTDDASVRGAVESGPDAVVHLAAVASNREANADPGQAWTVNAAGTARLAEALGRRTKKAGAMRASCSSRAGKSTGQARTRRGVSRIRSHRRRPTRRAKLAVSWRPSRSSVAPGCRS